MPQIEAPIVVACINGNQVWELRYEGRGLAQFRDTEDGREGAALFAQHLAGKYQIQNIDIQATPEMAAKFRATSTNRRRIVLNALGAGGKPQ